MNLKFPSKRSNNTATPKGWGEELIIHANENYCVKILTLHRGGECSLHFHTEKEESFLVLEGKVEVELFFNLERSIVTLEEGESLDIPPFMAHRFKAVVDSKLLEASNQDREEEDLIRIEGGDTQKAKVLPISNKDFSAWEGKCRRTLGL